MFSVLCCAFLWNTGTYTVCAIQFNANTVNFHMYVFTCMAAYSVCLYAIQMRMITVVNTHCISDN